MVKSLTWEMIAWLQILAQPCKSQMPLGRFLNLLKLAFLICKIPTSYSCSYYNKKYFKQFPGMIYKCLLLSFQVILGRVLFQNISIILGHNIPPAQQLPVNALRLMGEKRKSTAIPWASKKQALFSKSSVPHQEVQSDKHLPASEVMLCGAQETGTQWALVSAPTRPSPFPLRVLYLSGYCCAWSQGLFQVQGYTSSCP